MEFWAITLAFHAIFRDLLESLLAGSWTGCPELLAVGYLVGAGFGVLGRY
jgi:hypothetical protein